MDISRRRMASSRTLKLALGLSLALTATTPQALAAQALSGDRFRAENGETIRLSCLRAPLKTAAPEWAERAQQALDALLRDAPPAMACDPATPSRDRYGQVSAQIHLDASPTGNAPVWLQGQLLSEGLAFVDPSACFGETPRLADMIAREAEARAARRGIWSAPFYQGKPATDMTAQDEGRYAFVRGKVVDAVRVKNKGYLNFGPDWRTDFTLMIAARDLRAFKEAGLAPLALKGRTLLARGWIIHNFGPMIELTNPAQITILKEQE